MKLILLSAIAALASAATGWANDGFVEYCQNKDKTSAAKVTIAAMAKSLETTDCKTMASIIEAEGHLVLDDPELTDLKAATFFPNLELLELVSRQKLDLSQIAPLTSLGGLRVNAPIEAFPIVSDKLEVLSLTNFEAISLEDVIKNTAIRALELAYGKVSDYSALTKLAALDELAIADGGFTKLSDLPVLPKISALAVTHSPLSDLTGLDKFTGLAHLDVSSNQITDISLVAKLPQLESISVGANPLKAQDLSPLASLKGLTTLELANLNLEDLSFLADHPALTTLNLSQNYIKDLTPILKFSDLEYLDITSNELQNIDVVAGIRNLQWLFAADNYIASPIKLPVGTFQLVLSRNNITSLAWLNELKLEDLEWLEIDNNKISDLAPVSSLPMLSYLYFANNQVHAFPKLSKAGNLLLVDGRHNKIENIDHLAAAEGLGMLDLRNNRIKTVAALKDLKELISLKLDGNYLGTKLHKTAGNCPTDGSSELVKAWCQSKWNTSVQNKHNRSALKSAKSGRRFFSR